MENQSDYNEALMLIIDEFEGSISNEDLQKLQLWRTQTFENERIYQEFHAIKIEVDALVNLKQLNVDDAWARVDANLDDHIKVLPLIAETLPAKSNKKIKFWLSIAASLTFLLGFFLYQQNNAIQTFTTNKGGHLRFLLPDGSFVALNEETEVQFNSSNFANNRVVKLIKGEAYLVVTHNAMHPFKVFAGDAVVEDLGTVFSVARSDNSVKVFVSSGKVMLKSSENGSSKLILPQHTAEFQSDIKSLNEIPSQAGTLNWVQQSLSFNNANLSEIVSKLGTVYNVQITLANNTLNSRKLTANLSYQTLDSALAIVSASLQLKVNKANGKYILTN